MKGIVEERAAMLGEYIIESKATVRSTAKKFGVSKSTVHKAVLQQKRNICKRKHPKAEKAENQLQYGSYTIQNRIFRVYFGYFRTLLFMTCVV